MKVKSSRNQDIAYKFASATKHKDIELLNSLLADDGIFENEDKDRWIQEVTKNQFLDWYIGKLNDSNITDIRYDQCIHCLIGKTVIIFNKGKFPRSIKDDSERMMTGLAFDFKNDKIIRIKFCFTFLKTENKYVFQCRGEKIQEFIEQGLSETEAIQKALNISALDLD